MQPAAEQLRLRWRPTPSTRPAPIAKYLPLMRAGVAASPRRPDLKLHLVQALFATGAMDEIVERMRPALNDDETRAELLYYLGRAALATCDHQLAAAALQMAGKKGISGAFGYLAQALARLGRVDDALDAARRGLEYTPAGFVSLRIIAEALTKRDQLERLWTLCLAHRARGAWGGWFSAVMASTAGALGLDAEREQLVDRLRWFSLARPPLPAGFHEGFGAELTALHSSDRPDDAARRVDQLELLGGPLTQLFCARVREAVEQYVAEREDLRDHPVMAHRPSSVSLHAWSLITHGDEAHDWHVHRAAWISGVYYVAMPDISASDAAHAGAIEFGLFPFGRGGEELRSHRWQVRPEPGMLLIFPSHYAHRTWPTEVAQPRVSVAFDIRPAGAPD
jgi:tetratricopeptide (TPR) repeat protein